MVSKAPTVPTGNESGGTSAKRLLFSKPSWSRSNNLSSAELFHRSEQVYVASAAEFDRKRRGKKAKKESESTPKDENAEPAMKRQRITEDEDTDDEEEDDEEDDEDEDGDGSEAGENKIANHYRSQPDCFVDANNASLAHTTSDTSQKRLTQPRPFQKAVVSPIICDDYQLKDQQIDRRKDFTSSSIHLQQDGPPMSTAIDLDYEDPSNAKALSMAKVETFGPTADSETDEYGASDDEFPELAKKARETARRKLLEEALPTKNSIPPYFTTCAPSRLPPSKALPPPDPILQILITSKIPNTTPLIVSRKLSQRLKDVRLAWADRQQFPSNFTQHVFLTWRGKRLFDVTTCKSLGVRVDIEGRVLAKGDVLGDEKGRIHMEAMTAEILEARRKAKTEEADESAREVETDKQIEKNIDNQIRIILKAKGLEDFKLKVKATTLVSKILNAFRHAHNVTPEGDVYIMFEGQRLEPGSTIEDAEIADLDTLDTYVR